MNARIEIVPACLRDLTYITAYMRSQDAEEVYCQLPEATVGLEVALTLLATDAYVARLDGQPVMAFGTHPLSTAAVAVWAIGTDRTPRVAAAVARFFRAVVAPRLIADGYETMEARSLASHRTAHRWMALSGGEVIGPPFIFGRGRKLFLLFRWTADAFRAISDPCGASQGPSTGPGLDASPTPLAPVPNTSEG